jgi:ABC-type multidrug transport system fused ATPase/permease subunit
MVKDESTSEILDNYTKSMEIKLKKGVIQTVFWIVATAAVYFIWGTAWFFWLLFAISLILLIAVIFLKVAMHKFGNTLNELDTMREEIDVMTSGLDAMTSSLDDDDESDEDAYEEPAYTRAQQVLEKLLNELEEIGEEHSELYDTECREQMREVIHQSFIMQNGDYVIPDSVGLFSDEGNKRVIKALSRYLIAIESVTEDTSSLQERLAIFQDDEVYSDDGQSMDDFFGWVES